MLNCLFYKAKLIVQLRFSELKYVCKSVSFTIVYQTSHEVSIVLKEVRTYFSLSIKDDCCFSNTSEIQAFHHDTVNIV